MKRRQPEQPGRKKSKAPLRLETLERRVLFSADLPFVSDALGASDPSAAPIVGSTVTGEESEAESQQAQPLELVVVDPSADDFESVLQEAEARSASGFQAYLLSPDVDGLAQLSEILTEHRNVSALHLLTAGTDSEITLGGSTLTLMDMLANADEVAGWGESFAAESSWQIYGSGMADSDQGLNFVTTLSDLTGTDVAVSTGFNASAWSGPVTTGETPEAEAAAESTDSAVEERLELVFIDTDTPDYEQLLADLQTERNDGRHIEVILLDRDRDGIDQISETLALYQGVDAVHLISHGTEGAVQLGNTWLTNDTFSTYERELASWSSALSEDADILFYGCDLAGSQDGETLVASIAQLTGADVAASADLTGHASVGGDWDLEFQVGALEAQVAVSEVQQSQWAASLDISGGLQAHLTFDAGQGAQDASGNNRDGTLNGDAAVDTTPASNQVGDGKLTLDGTDDYVNLNAHAAALDSFTEGTIGAWINTSAANQQMIFKLGDTAGSSFASLQLLSDGTLQWWVSEGGSTTVQANSSAALNDGNWHHVAVTVGPSGTSLWVDGTELTGGAITYTTGSAASTNFFDDLSGVAQAEVGAYELSGTVYDELTGLVDDFRIYDRALTAGDIAELQVTNHAPTFIGNSIGYWNFDEGGGDTTAESALGISTGTLGSTAGADANDPTWTTGRFGQALHFDGVDDYVEIADAPEIDISGPEFSASLWMNPDVGPNTEDMLFMKGDRQGNVNYYLSWKDTGVMTWAFKDGAGWHYQDMAVTLPTTGQWNHVAITFDRPTVSLYINGTKYVFDNVATGGSMDRDLTANDDVLWIGAGRSGGALVGANQYSGPFTGSIDDLAIFDRALTDAEVDALLNSAPPVATASAFNLDENAANNTIVGTVVATDQDVGDTLSYAITAGNTGGAFSIDGNGQILVANSGALDFETNPIFNLTIEATDDGAPSLSDTTGVTISLNNVNDAPTVSATALSPTWTEGAGPVAAFSSTSIDTVETGDLINAILVNVTGLADGSAETLMVDGQAIELTDLNSVTTAANGYAVDISAPGGIASITISKSGGFSTAAAETLIDGLAYDNSSDTPQGAARMVTLAAIQDDGGVANGGLDTTVYNLDSFVTISATNDAPVITSLDGSPTFIEDGVPVVLDSDVTITDTELSAADNFNGATLTLVRNGGASIDDAFSASGSLAPLAEGLDLVVGGTTIGTVTANSAGTLVLTFDGNATNALVDQALQQIAYSNSNDAPPASVQIDWTIDDGNTGVQGTGGALQAVGSTTISITAVNDAPVIAEWFNDAWDTRRSLTINAANVAGDLTNFPVLITLNTDAELAAQALANGDDIVFTAADGTTQLAHEIELFDETTGELRVWVKTDLSASADTNIYMYFGNAASGNQENVSGVWDNYVGVYHLSESPTGALGELADSSGSGNHATTEGAMDGTDSVPTAIGEGLSFDGTNDMIRILDSASLDSINDEATFSLWINFVDAADGDHQLIMSSANRYSGLDGYEWGSQDDGDHFFYPDAGTPDVNYNLGLNPFTNDTWHHVAATMNFATKEVNIYVDGTPMTFTYDGVSGNWTSLSSSGDLLFGGNPERAERFFLGMMDEIRIADVARSQEWIQTEVNNQKTPGTFISVGTVEDREDKLTDINEDDFNSPGDSVLSIISSSGADRIADDDAGAVEGIAVTAADDTNGQWQYDANADGSWLAFGAVSESSAVLLDTSALIRFVPNADYNGSAGDLTFHAWDQSTGSNGDIAIDVSTNGGSSAYSSQTFDATLNVLPVADAPVFGGADAGAVTEDVGVVTGNISDSGTLTITDADAGESSFQAATINGAYGDLIIDTAGNWSYTADNSQAAIQALDVGETLTDTLTVAAFDGTTHDVVITINGAEDAPVFDSTPVTAATEDAAYSYTITTSDVDGDTLSINGLTVPAWLTLTDNGDGTATLTGTPTNAEVGPHSVSLEVTDGALTATQNFTLTVNSDPTFTSPASFTVPENTTAVGTVTSTDVDGGAPQYTLVGAVDDGLFSIDVNSGALSFNAAPDFEAPADSGGDNVYNLTVQVNDGNGGIVSQAITVTVTDVNETPVDILVTGSTTGGLSLNNDGGNDTYLVADSGLTTPLTQFTFEVQFEGSNGSTEVPFISYNTPSGDIMSINTMSNNTLELDIGTGSVVFSSAVDYNATLMDGQRHTLSVSWDNSAGDWAVYIDGSLIDNGTGLSTGQTIPTGGTLMFGLEQDSVGGNFESHEYFNGTLFDIRLFDDVRTAEEIATHQRETLANTEPNLLANWTLDDLSTDGVITENVSGNNLTVQHHSGTGFSASTPVLQLTVRDDAVDGTAIGNVSATDPDTGETFTYALTDTASGRFAISNGGEISVADASQIDYAINTSHDITIRVTDSGGLTYDKVFTILVTGNEAPVFDSTPVTAATEDVAYSYTVTTSDVDGDVLSINGLTVPAWLTLTDNGDGTATLSGTPTNAEVGDHSVSLEVSDGSLTATQSFTLTVSNVNDDPVFTSPASFGVAENVTAVGTVTSTDVDGGAPQYTLVGAVDDGLFSIDINSGALSFNAAPDFESPTDSGGDNVYNLTVQVDDGNGGNVNQAISVTVTNVNEAGVSVIGDTDAALDTVAEDATVGTTVGITADASDSDAGDTVTYSLDNDAGGLFTIDTNTGVVTVAGALDYESATNHDITVRATSTDASFTTRTFTIAVGDVNDNAPVVTAAQTFNINEDAVLNDVVGSVAATDADTVGSLQGWTITAGNTDGIFQINGTTGQITVADPTNLNHEVTPQYTLTVQVSDGVNTSASETLVIDIVDVNEAPTFTSAPLTTATEDALYSYTITTNDVDGDVLSINGLTVPAWLTLTDNGDGTATLSGTPTNAEVGDHSVSLEVSDGSLTATQSFTLTVSNVNDDPVFTSPASFGVAENVTAVGTVTSTDVDGGAPQYTLVGAVDDGLFSIDVNSGALSFNTAPDFEAPADTGGDNVYNLTVQVDDGNGGIINQAISVTVTNVNESGITAISDTDAAPETVAEDASSGTTVGITAFADDADATDTVSYSLDDNAGGLFTIDTNTGVVTVNGALDYETATSHDITVRAASTDTSFSTRTFSIAVSDVNETGITAISDTDAALDTVAEDASPGTSVGITAFADDADGTDTVSYSLDDDAGGLFTVDTLTGAVTVNAALDYESSTSQNIILRATSTDGSTTTRAFTIGISDVNDSAPVVTPAQTFNVNEDAVLNDVVGSVAATDVDTVGSLQGWTITAGNTDGIFAINASTGQVTIADPTNLDFEATPQYTLTVQVSDGVNTSATETVVIDVNDVNEAPVFDSTPVTAAAEDVAYSYTITTSDVDGDVLSINGLTVPAWLTLTDNGDGTATLTGTPTNAEVGDHSVSLEVSDGSLTATQNFTLTVSNVNDDPIFTSPASFSVAENVTIVGTVTSTDVDGGAPQYTLVGAVDDGLFSIDVNSGALSFNAAPDFESPADSGGNNVYDLTVQVNDGNGGIVTQSVSVTVTNVNESGASAIVDNDGTTDAINEDATIGTAVGITAFADDADSGDTVSYSLEDDAGGLFTIDANTGVVTVAGALDYETASSHSITVRATSTDTSFTTQSFTIAVGDVNDNAPVVTAAQTFNVNEDALVNDVVGTVAATDVDTVGSLQGWTITAGNTDGIFQINGTTGEISIADPSNLNFEATPQYTLTVLVSDGVNTSATETVVIDVNDVNEAPVFDSTPVTAATEDVAYSYTITTSDVDGDTLSINGLTVPAWLTLTDNGDGTATLSGTPTNAEVGDHSVSIEVTDGALTATQSFTLTVSNVNDDPVFTSPASFSVAENITTVGTVTSTDVDGGAPQYTLVGAVDDGLFSIDVNSGALSFNAAPDFESPADSGGDNVYDLTVQVDDGNGGIVNQTISVTVTNVNESGVSVIGDTDAALDTVAEDATVGTTVGITADASDSDAGDTVSYSLDDDAGGLFAIDANSGVVTVNGALDYETATSHDITVRATSTDTSFSTRTFSIAVGDVNDTAPVVTAAQTFNVNEDAALNDVVGTVAATDADSVGTLQGWTITAGNGAGVFAINVATGEITVADPTNLDFEATPQYTLTVQVSDGVNTSATETVVIDVNDVNEAPNLPVLSVSTVDENIDTSAGYTVGTLSATDADTGDLLTFEVAGGLDADVFSIGGLNGDELIIDDGLLDFERQSSYDVRIRVTDSGGLSSELDFSITVNDLNDAPQPGADILTVMEDSPLVIDLVADLLANDLDQDSDPLTVVDMTQPANGVLMDNLDGTWTYLANANYTGLDQFQYQVSDASGAMATATVSIDVQPVNDDPMLSMPASTSVGENSTGTVTTIQASDVDGDPISLQLGGADSGSFTLDAATGEIRFNSAPDFEGPADAGGDNQYQLQVTASDGAGGSVSLPISINVSDVNEAPELHSTDFTSVQGFSGSVGSLRFSDPDFGDQVQITAIGGSGANLFSVDPTSGEITQSGDSPPGVYTLDVELTDSQGATATGTLTITLGSLETGSEASIIKLISETEPEPYNDATDTDAAEDADSGAEDTQQASDDPAEEGGEASAGTEVPGRASPTDAAFAGQAVAGGQTDVEASSAQPQRLPGQGDSYSRGAHTMVLELLLEETDELVEIAFGGTVDSGIDLSRTSLSLSPSMLSALEEMRANVDTVADQDEEQADLLVQTGAVATLSLTAGFVTWLLRTGSLLATVLSTSPLWRPFDPIPVLVDLQDASRPDLGEELDEV